MLRSILEQFLSKCWALISALFRYLLEFAYALFQKLVSLVGFRELDYGYSGYEETVDTHGIGLIMAFFRAEVVFRLVIAGITALTVVWLYKLVLKLLRG